MPAISPFSTLPIGLSESSVTGLLAQTANQVAWIGNLDKLPQIDAYVRGQSMPIGPRDFTDSFRGGLKLGFGGTCADKIGGRFVNITDGRYDPFIHETVAGLAGSLSVVVFGGTYWSWMPALARAAVGTARVPLIGVMPVSGLESLYEVRGLFEGPDAVPKMNYLAIVGDTYRDPIYTNFMAQCYDGLVSIGGRAGAAAEVDASLGLRKPVFLAPVGSYDDQAWIYKEVLGGVTYPKDVQTLVDMLRKDFVHDEPLTGRRLSFRNHINPYEYKTRHARDITIGIVSTSGAMTDTHRLEKIVGPLLSGLHRKTWSDSTGNHKAIILGGLTAMGGIGTTYDAALKAKLATAGIMTWQGTSHGLVRGVQEMIIVGDEWGAESSDFVGLADIMLVLGPPKERQGWNEALKAASMGKPIIIMEDPFLASDRLPVDGEKDNVFFFQGNQPEMGARAINAAIEMILDQRRII